MAYYEILVTEKRNIKASPKKYFLYADSDDPKNLKDMAITELLDEIKTEGKDLLFHEIFIMYNIEIIGKAPNCYGCRHDLGGQRDHMECNTGCLHNSDYCGCENK